MFKYVINKFKLKRSDQKYEPIREPLVIITTCKQDYDFSTKNEKKNQINIIEKK